MKVFILEDDLFRVDLFSQWLVGCEWERVDTCRDVKKFSPPYDLIFLDHDLGGRQIEEHEDCGYTFVQMVKDKINKDALVVVHSYNPEGAKRMVEALQGAGLTAWRTPFGREIAQIIEIQKERLNEETTS